MQRVAIYLHLPYCLYKCHYCDFNSYQVSNVTSLEGPYIQAIKKQAEQFAEQMVDFEIPSIFLGGGTPSLFSPEAIAEVLAHLRSLWKLSADCEVSLEANPKTVTLQKIQGYLQAGVNRFSLGVQSFEDRYLSPLGRLHSGKEALEAAETIAQAGPDSWSLDLMFAFPNQTVEEVLADLNQAILLKSQHLSFYNLTLEPNTIFSNHVRQGKIALPEQDVQAEMYEAGLRCLEEAGYKQYEISNFAKHGFVSRHNLAYWNYQDYLSFGAGAVSFIRKELVLEKAEWETAEDLWGYRWMGELTPSDYLHSVKDPACAPTKELISVTTAQKEFFMMGLRLNEGVSILAFKKYFGDLTWQAYEPLFKELEGQGRVVFQNERLMLTQTGRILMNEVLLKIF